MRWHGCSRAIGVSCGELGIEGFLGMEVVRWMISRFVAFGYASFIAC